MLAIVKDVTVLDAQLWCMYNWAMNSRKVPTPDRHLRVAYNMTGEDYEYRLIFQNRRCAICGWYHREDEKLVVDHSHETGQVRGLLCHKCNVGIGMLKDNLTVLRSAVDYLDSVDGRTDDFLTWRREVKHLQDPLLGERLQNMAKRSQNRQWVVEEHMKQKQADIKAAEELKQKNLSAIEVEFQDYFKTTS